MGRRKSSNNKYRIATERKRELHPTMYRKERTIV